MEIPIQPMEPILRRNPFDDPDFLYQVKWDGIRCISLWNGEQLQNLWGKKGQVMTSHYPNLRISSSQKGALLFDGEIVLLNPEGKPSFPHLMKVHLHHKKRIPAGYSLAYMVFDLLMRKDHWVTTKPLVERQNLLQEILIPSQTVQIVPSFSDGKLLFQVTGEHQLEGIVAKRKNSAYNKGKCHQDWFKIKHNVRLSCVLGGVLWKEEEKKQIRSLLVGAYYENKLHYIGSVSSGLTAKDLTNLKNSVTHLEQNQSPFTREPHPRAPVTWMNPILTMEVEFMEWSPDQKMRAPHIIGFLTKSPQDCLLNEEPLTMD